MSDIEIGKTISQLQSEVKENKHEIRNINTRLEKVETRLSANEEKTTTLEDVSHELDRRLVDLATEHRRNQCYKAIQIVGGLIIVILFLKLFIP